VDPGPKRDGVSLALHTAIASPLVPIYVNSLLAFLSYLREGCFILVLLNLHLGSQSSWRRTTQDSVSIGLFSPFEIGRLKWPALDNGQGASRGNYSLQKEAPFMEECLVVRFGPLPTAGRHDEHLKVHELSGIGLVRRL